MKVTFFEDMPVFGLENGVIYLNIDCLTKDTKLNLLIELKEFLVSDGVRFASFEKCKHAMTEDEKNTFSSLLKRLED